MSYVQTVHEIRQESENAFDIFDGIDGPQSVELDDLQQILANL